jgi:uncharacterized protein (TIGR03086 family)
MTDLRAYHREALDVARTVVAAVDPAALDRPTPCSAWTLGQLLAHMTGQNHGFAASARGETRDLGIWADRPVGAEPAKVFGESADAVAAAFAEDGVLGRGFWLPEIRDGRLFPAELAIGFHFVDSVVHAWDVAKSLGAPLEFDAALLDAVLPIALAVPDGDNRLAEGASFRPGREVSEGAPTLDQVVAVLGRDPQWTPAAR